ncbi:30 kDa salivary gland allergen Aed a 3-like [Sabethes cyaneus]|nr:30 kDa salivary gland allergen Aed a 3-like [Sabethes cyaneus]
MKPLLKIFIAFCLMSFVVTIPIAQDETEDSSDGNDDEESSPGDGEEDRGDSPDSEEDEDQSGEEDGDDHEETEGKEKAGEDDETDEDAENGEDEKDTGSGDDKSSENGEGEKDDRVNTYNKVSDIIKEATKSDKIEDEYFKSFVENSLQAYIRNPVINAIGTIGQFSKIEECFKSIGKDVEKVLTEKNKAFAECKKKPDAREDSCAHEHNNAAGSELEGISSKVLSCVSSKGA